jgi:hypothetical protein
MGIIDDSSVAGIVPILRWPGSDKNPGHSCIHAGEQSASSVDLLMEHIPADGAGLSRMVRKAISLPIRITPLVEPAASSMPDRSRHLPAPQTVIVSHVRPGGYKLSVRPRACYLFAGMFRSLVNGMISAQTGDPENQEAVMNTPNSLDERQRFYRLQMVGREQHAAEVKRMSRAELGRYMAYLSELQRVDLEEYRAMFGSRS